MSRLLFVFLRNDVNLTSALWRYNINNPHTEKGFNVAIPFDITRDEFKNRFRGVEKHEKIKEKLFALRQFKDYKTIKRMGFEIDSFGNVGKSNIIEKTINKWDFAESLLVKKTGENAKQSKISDLNIFDTMDNINDHLLNKIHKNKYKCRIDAILDGDEWNVIQDCPINIAGLILEICFEKYINKDVVLYLINYE